MSRADRHMSLLRILRDGNRHLARDLAAQFDVSERTIYRDMEALIAAGVPVAGRPGAGYQATRARNLPPLMLTAAQVDALMLGVAIVAEAADPDLAEAARTLGAKIDAALPAETLPAAEAWKAALTPLADKARGLSHMAVLRGAIRARQKLRLALRDTKGVPEQLILRPLRLDNFGPVWSLLGWSESDGTFREMRLDLIEIAEALPELFMDDPGTTLNDYKQNKMRPDDRAPRITSL